MDFFYSLLTTKIGSRRPEKQKKKTAVPRLKAG